MQPTKIDYGIIQPTREDYSDRIRALQLEACVYGDPEMVSLCERALNGDSDALHVVITMLDYASEAYHDHD